MTIKNKGKHKASENLSAEHVTFRQSNLALNPPSIYFDKPKKSTEKSDNEGYKKIEVPIEAGNANSRNIEKKIRLLNFISSIFKALLTILRNSKSDRHSKRNVTRSKRPDNPEFKNKGNWNKSENKQPTSKPQSSKYKKCAHCSCTNHATKDCWFSPQNKGKTKPGKKNVNAIDKNVLMTQEQFNAVLERLPQNPKSGKRKVRDFTPKDLDAEIVEMFSSKTTISTTAVDTKDDSDASSIYCRLHSCEILSSKDDSNSKKKKTTSQNHRSCGRRDRNWQTRHRSHFARHWGICDNHT
jgi:hypothetical protein